MTKFRKGQQVQFHGDWRFPACRVIVLAFVETNEHGQDIYRVRDLSGGRFTTTNEALRAIGGDE